MATIAYFVCLLVVVGASIDFVPKKHRRSVFGKNILML